MSFSDDILIAYADGELDEASRRAVELAMRHDPSLAARVRRHQALRRDVYGTVHPVLEEVVPQRLNGAGRSGKVVHLDSVRAARTPALPPPPRRWSWPEWGALTATLVLGMGGGALAMRAFDAPAQPPQLALANGVLSARGVLDQALTQQLASAGPRQAQVRVGLSFRARDGNYCRVFMLPKSAGLACRSGTGWRVPVLAEDSNTVGGVYHMGGSALPEAVLDAIDQRIAGKALDIGEEQAARDKGWAGK